MLRWFEKITGIWEKWHDMQGDNPPLERNTAGPRRDFDINLDGLAHYGLLPDFLQDMRNQGWTRRTSRRYSARLMTTWKRGRSAKGARRR